MKTGGVASKGPGAMLKEVVETRGVSEPGAMQEVVETRGVGEPRSMREVVEIRGVGEPGVNLVPCKRWWKL